MKREILLTEPLDFSRSALKILRELGEVQCGEFSREKLLNVIGQTQILWVRLGHRIDEEILVKARMLEYIVTPTTGLNHIDMELATKREVRVLSLKGEYEFLSDVRATAEHTIGVIMSLLRNLPSAISHTRKGLWDRDLFKGRELYRATVGIIGFGRIGRQVHKYLTAFGCHILVTDPKIDPENYPMIEFVELITLLRTASIISVHVDYNSKTKGFLGEDQFGLMREDAILVNNSRGELVDEDALLRALEKQKIAGAALDVLANEHGVTAGNHPLVQFSRSNHNLQITPHIGGCTRESMEKTEVFMAQKLLRCIKCS